MCVSEERRFAAKISVSLALIGGVFLLYSLAYYRIIDPEGKPFFILSYSAPAIAVAVALVFILGLLMRLRPSEEQRRIWALFAIASLLNLAAETIWLIYQGILGREISYPLLADIFWLSSYPFLIAGLLLLLRGYRRLDLGFRRYTVGPVVALILLVIALVTVFLVIPVVTDDSATLTDKLINPAYAYLDMLILAPSLMVALSFSGGWQGKAWMLISLSFILMALADTLFVYLDWNGLYGNVNHIDLLWVASYLTLGIAAAWQELILARSLRASR